MTSAKIRGLHHIQKLSAFFYSFRLLSLIYLCFQAVGEPPLFLASSVFYAIKDAVIAAR